MEKEECVHESEINMIYSQMEAYWQKRDWYGLLALIEKGTMGNESFLPHIEDRTMTALKQFISLRSNSLDIVRADDRCGLVFLQAVLKIQKHRFPEALADLEKLAYDGHYHPWLGAAISDLLFGLITDKHSLLFPRESLNKAIEGKILMDDSICEDRFCLLFPANSRSCHVLSVWGNVAVETI